MQYLKNVAVMISREVSQGEPPNTFTIKPVLSGHSKIDKTKILLTNGILMQVERIAECSILQYFDLH